MHTSKRLTISQTLHKNGAMGLDDFASSSVAASSVMGDDVSVATSGRFGTQYSSDSDFEVEDAQPGANMWNSWGPLKTINGALVGSPGNCVITTHILLTMHIL
jgi:hypothetical protein